MIEPGRAGAYLALFGEIGLILLSRPWQACSPDTGQISSSGPFPCSCSSASWREWEWERSPYGD